MSLQIHASCVELHGKGLLLRGPAGAGKSSLALSLINRGFRLVADDQVCLYNEEGSLKAKSAEGVQGLLEVRGIGILRMHSSPACSIDYIVDLIPGLSTDRMPEPNCIPICNISLPSFKLNPVDPKTVERLMILYNPNFLGFLEEDLTCKVSEAS